MASILQIKKDNEYVNVPILRGKSAYEHALDGGLQENITETNFNKMLGNFVYGDGVNYQIKVVNSKPSTFDPNVITIVLSD